MSEQRHIVGLRVDVDTWRGTEYGVPCLQKIFADRSILASFFFSVGPDNMGRHLWRLLRPAFLLKMLRSNAASLYGWDILLRGTFWPGPNIGKGLATQIRDIALAGHDVGFHAWDHHHWQKRSEEMSATEVHADIAKGLDALQDILGQPVLCSAAAGWKCSETALLEKEAFGFKYASDCRGTSIFRPDIRGQLCIPQVPVTLPTYDEVIGINGVTDTNYNTVLLDHLRPGALNVLTIHAEVEGIARRELFEDFLDLASAENVDFVPLVELLPPIDDIPTGKIYSGHIDGRDGEVCLQAK